MSSLSPEARKLLEASRSAGAPSAAQRVAMKQAVLASVVLPGTAAAVSSAATGAKAAGLALATKVGLVIAVVAIGAVAVMRLTAPTPFEQQALDALDAHQAARAQPPVPERAELQAEETPPPPQQPAVPGVVAPRLAPARVAVPPPAAPPPAAPVVVEALPPPPARTAVDEATLSREIAALSGAMGAVDSKTYAVALEQLTQYRSAFPTGLLETEASVLEVLALCGLGRVDEARAAGQSLPANNPAVRRLERSCIASGK